MKILMFILVLLLVSCNSSNKHEIKSETSKEANLTKQTQKIVKGSGDKVVTVSLKAGIAIIHLKVEHNYLMTDAFAMSQGEGNCDNISLDVKDASGILVSGFVNTAKQNYDGSISATAPCDGTYYIEVGTSQYSAWTLFIE
jgi:hypothetical protein